MHALHQEVGGCLRWSRCRCRWRRRRASSEAAIIIIIITACNILHTQAEREGSTGSLSN